jgi:hypothetical protein
MMHAGAPDVASGLTRESVIDRCGQHFRTERQQKLEDAVTESIKVPAGLTEEAVKGGVVFEAAQLSGLDYTCERSAAGAENPGAGQGPEGGEAGLGKAGLKGEQEGKQKTGRGDQASARLKSLIDVMKDMQSNKAPQRFLRSSSRSRLRLEICFSHF